MNKKEEKYPDYNFFMSLLGDFSGINSDLKMDAKMEIMGVIKKYMQISKYSGQNSNYGSPGYFTSMDSSSNSSHTLALTTSQNFIRIRISVIQHKNQFMTIYLAMITRTIGKSCKPGYFYIGFYYMNKDFNFQSILG